MEIVALEMEVVHLQIGDFDSGGVGRGIEFGLDAEAFVRGCGGDELDNDFMADEGFAAPVSGDVAKQTMLDLVPFAGSWWKMTDVYLQARRIGEVLQCDFPQFAASAVAAAGVDRAAARLISEM